MSTSIRTNSGTFSERVQQHLRAGGYSQKELAAALGLNPKVLSRKLNGNANAHLTHLEIERIIMTLARWHAIITQDEAFQLLELAQLEPTIFSADEWETPPLNTLSVRHAAPTASNGSEAGAASLSYNVPAPTTQLIGREGAVGRLLHLLRRDEVRLVTLVGTGGSGKTRLALHVAHKLVGTFEHGVWFVALAGVRDPAQMPLSIFQTLNIKTTSGVPALQSLITHLKHKHLLLVLDNFEQIEAAAEMLDEMLAGIPGLKLLVTSRVVLRLSGEHKFSVPPLEVPDPGVSLVTTELLRYGAIQLFVERAQDVAPTFTLTDENAAIITQICARVDGLPLALELAAARMRALSPALLLERLSQARLSMLTRGARNLPGRQQTLRNTITWSYDLLSPAEQRWFNRLGIFTGGWSFEDAEAMLQCRIEDQADATDSCASLDMLERLLDNSLVVRLPDTHRRARFMMLETLREYAQEQLAAQGVLDRWRDWHACYYLQQAEAAELGMRGPQQLDWLARLTTDRDNFRAALEWALHRARDGMRISAFPFLAQASCAGRKAVAGSVLLSVQGNPWAGLSAAELALRLAAAFRPYWEWQGYLTEARNWVEAALEAPSGDAVGETFLAARAKALSEAARLTSLENDQSRAVALVDESIELCQQVGDSIGLAAALLHRAWIAFAVSEYETAKGVCQQGLEHLSARDDPWLHAQLLFYLGTAAGFTSDFERMRMLYTQSRELFEQLGDTCGVVDVLKDHGAMMILESKYDDSITYLLKSIRLSYKLDHKQFVTTGLCWLSIAIGLRSQPNPALASIHSAQLDGASEGLMETIGLIPWTKTHPFVLAVQQYIRSRVDEESWATAWNAGHALTIEQAVNLACKLGEGVHLEEGERKESHE